MANWTRALISGSMQRKHRAETVGSNKRSETEWSERRTRRMVGLGQEKELTRLELAVQHQVTWDKWSARSSKPQHPGWDWDPPFPSLFCEGMEKENILSGILFCTEGVLTIWLEQRGGGLPTNDIISTYPKHCYHDPITCAQNKHFPAAAEDEKPTGTDSSQHDKESELQLKQKMMKLFISKICKYKHGQKIWKYKHLFSLLQKHLRC